MGAEGREQAPETPEKKGAARQCGAESGAVAHDSGFGVAVAALMGLPLTDAEKADAVRRLLANVSEKHHE
jgi:hypothetical protein